MRKFHKFQMRYEKVREEIIMMRKVFQDQLEELHVELIQMGALCERAILSA